MLNWRTTLTVATLLVAPTLAQELPGPPAGTAQPPTPDGERQTELLHAKLRALAQMSNKEITKIVIPMGGPLIAQLRYGMEEGRTEKRLERREAQLLEDQANEAEARKTLESTRLLLSTRVKHYREQFRDSPAERDDLLLKCIKNYRPKIEYYEKLVEYYEKKVAIGSSEVGKLRQRLNAIREAIELAKERISGRTERIEFEVDPTIEFPSGPPMEPTDPDVSEENIDEALRSVEKYLN